MPLHIALQILLKGLLPLTAVGGAIGGLVYQFSPVASKSDIEALEDALKNLDSPIGDNEQLKEKIKELADKLSEKKKAIDSLKNSLEETDTSKKALTKKITDSEAEIDQLLKDLDKLEGEKTTQEEELTKALLKKTDVTQKHKKATKKQKQKKSIVDDLKEWEIKHSNNITTFTQQLSAKKAEHQKLEAEYQEQYKYNQKLDYYNSYLINGFWYWASSRGIKAEDFSNDSAVLTQTIIKKKNITNLLVVKKQGVYGETLNLQHWINNNKIDLETTKTKLVTAEPALKTAEDELAKSQEELNNVNKEVSDKETTLNTTKNEMAEKTTKKDELTTELPTIKQALETTNSLLISQTAELTKHEEETVRLKSLAQRILANNKDDPSVVQMLPSDLS